ncbi:helix-turn-helix domain-containing protein [Streptomyces sp. SID5770]|uniref:helix-turn-helix domain-containing protein n=1 Tax=Streptomyces sp. SID5770 TaxID=2690308 RepID=UPI001368138C|nr:helix-turn-helix transcriptional regulator [Streptomyces sp. SID5770]MZE56149.1 helix-turn-helix domain-containing protein [Streptomyces sp. SID5770]
MTRHFSGARLRASRKAAGVSIELLAVIISRSAYSVLEYERGRVTPPIDVLAAIADALGRKVEDLLEERDAAQSESERAA